MCAMHHLGCIWSFGFGVEAARKTIGGAQGLLTSQLTRRSNHLNVSLPLKLHFLCAQLSHAYMQRCDHP